MRTLSRILPSLLFMAATAWGQLQPAMMQSAPLPCQPGDYCAYTKSAIVQWPSVLPDVGGPAGNGAVVHDLSFPFGVASDISRCTTQTLMASTVPNQTKIVGPGSSGASEQQWNANDTMLTFMGTGGQTFITVFNPVTMQCGDPVTGHAVTADKNLTNPGSSTTVYDFGTGSFDWIKPNIYYAFADGSDAVGPQLIKYTFDASGNFTVGPVLADFTYGFPVGSNAPAWQANHAYTTGQYVSYTMQASDSLRPFVWQANYSLFQAGDIIVPTTNNPLNCAFKASTAGTTGSSAPTWSTGGGVCASASNSVIIDGTARWRNLGGGATFVLQLISAGGTSGSTTPHFVPVATGHPDILTPTIADASLTWENFGLNILPVWVSFAGISEDGTRVCAGLSSNAYGYTGNYDLVNGGQGSGTYGQCYDSAINSSVLVNTANGMLSSTTCTGGTGYNCSGGTMALNYLGTSSLLATGGCGIFLHNVKGGALANFINLVRQGGYIPGSSGCPTGDGNLWRPFSAFNSTTSLQNVPCPLNHWAVGYSHLFNMGQGGPGCSSLTLGQYEEIFDLNSIATAPVVSWQPPCDVSWYFVNDIAPGNHATNDPLPPCAFAAAYDEHLSVAASGRSDTGPTCGTVYDLINVSNLSFAPWHGEEVCVSVVPTWSQAGTSLPGAYVWRFTHAFITGTNKAFNTQFGINQLSHTGRFLAWSSDWGGTLGDTSGGSTALFGYQWLANTAQPLNSFVNPFSNNNGSGTNYGVWKVTTAGTSSNTVPAWVVCGSGNVGVTVSQDGVVYTCQGSSNHKGEVFIVRLSPVNNATVGVPKVAAKLYVFGPPAGGGGQLATIYANADGGTVAIPWSGDVNPSKGGWDTSSGSASAGYSFTNFDAVINAQLGFGTKSIVLLLDPIAFGPTNNYTPSYVFTVGYATSIGSSTGQLSTCASIGYPGNGTITPGTCAQGVDSTAFPAAFQAPLVTAWKAAIIAAVNHVKNASYASKIAYVRVGGGSGAEWLPYSTAALETLCSPANITGLSTAWLAYATTIDTAIVAQNTGLTFAQSVNGGLAAPFNIPYSLADSEAALVISNGIGVGDQGLQNADIGTFAANGNASGGGATTGFSSNDFNYAFSLPGAIMHETQTYAASDPTYPLGTVPPRNIMGSLVDLLPFATASGADHIELYYADWQVAWDPASPNYAAYHAAYQAAMNTAQGK